MAPNFKFEKLNLSGGAAAARAGHGHGGAQGEVDDPRAQSVSSGV